MRLDGKIAIITGAGGDLGRALAGRFVAEGAAGVLLSDVDEGALDSTVLALQGSTAKVSATVADVRDRSAVDALVDQAIDAHGQLDVMVNNAGVLSANGRIHNLTPTDWHRVLDINFYGVLHGVESALRVMRPRQRGTIINTASVAGLTAWAYSAPYGVSKAAVVHLTKVAAVEYARENVRINCICPGAFPSRCWPLTADAQRSECPVAAGPGDLRPGPPRPTASP
jgi:3-oxoacyl-[acyl-carrier protein] reductase